MNLTVAKNLIYLPVQFARGENVSGCLDQARAFHRLPADQQRKIQWDKLKVLLTYVGNHNPYYRDLFEQSGIEVADLGGFEDIRQIPFLTKEIVQLQQDRLSSSGWQRYDHRSTTGSTGMPLEFTKDRRALAHMDAVMHEAYGWYGIEIGDRQGRIWSVPLSAVGRSLCLVKDRLLNRRRLNAWRNSIISRPS